MDEAWERRAQLMDEAWEQALADHRDRLAEREAAICAQAKAEERARVVAWLRGADAFWSAFAADSVIQEMVAAALERGEHDKP